ncbi:MAG TPA: ELWxxDGT repeat protein, partial [Pirellulaceae bacterium]|nr:ELWxxDGT repeat protein [Pirellulaceae bacterium]
MLGRHRAQSHFRRPARRQKFVEFFRPLRIEAIEDRALLTLTPQLVADINPKITQVAQASGPIVDVGGVAFFAANDGTTGLELWKSDGTSAGTMLVKDIFAGSVGSLSNYSYLTNVNGTLYFSAYDGSGIELWKSDGTIAGTTLVKGLEAGSGLDSPA